MNLGQFNNTGGLSNLGYEAKTRDFDTSDLIGISDRQGSSGMSSNMVTGITAGVGALSGITGGIMDNSNIKSQNKALDNGINTMQNSLRELKAKRAESLRNRRGEAANFLTNYITIRDPNRSSQIANMYSSGNERFRGEQSQSDAMESQISSNISNLQSQKQKEKSGLEIGLSAAASAAQAALPLMLMG